MKRLFAFAFSVLLTASMAGCTNNNKNDSNTTEGESTPIVAVGDKNTFMLSSLPDIGGYKKESEIKRRYPDFTDHLIPSDDYGELIPYIGNMNEYKYLGYWDDGEEWYTDNAPIYGLCTKDGTIVTDAVYTDISYCNGYYLLQSNAIKLPDDGDGYDDYEYKYFVAKSDGSSVAELSKTGLDAYACDNGIFCVNNSVESSDSAYFNADGTLIFDNEQLDGSENEKGLTVYDNGTMYMNMYSDSAGYACYLVDKNLEKVSDEYEWIIDCCENRYIVKDKNTELCGIIDNSGNVLIPLEYNEIDYESDMFVFRKGKTITVKNKNLEYVSSFDTAIDLEGVYLIGNDVIQIYTQSGGNYHDIYGNAIECEQIFSIDNSSEYYVMVKDGYNIILDGDLKEVGRIDDRYTVSVVLGENKAIVMDTEQITDSFPDTSILMDIKDNKIIKENVSYRYNEKEFYYVTEEGKDYAYSIKDNKMLFEVSGPIFSSETSMGKLYFYQSGDYVYTANDKFETILKMRTEED